MTGCHRSRPRRTARNGPAEPVLSALAADEFLDMAYCNGEENPLTLNGSSRHDTYDASAVTEEGSPRIPRIDGCLGLDSSRQPRNAIIVLPRVAWANLRNDTLC